MKRSFSRVGCCGLACLLGTTGVLCSQDASISVTWDSDYVSEGRKNLEHGGFIQAEVDFDLPEFAFTLWYGDGRRDNYRELNLVVEKGFEMGPVELGLSYTRLEFGGSEHGSDNELSAAAVLAPASQWLFEVGATWSFGARGAFVEARLSRDIATGFRDVVVRPYAVLASDFGYASSGYDGLNHWECGLEIEWPVTEKFAIGAHLARSEPLGDVRRDGGTGFFWGGASASVAF